MSGRSSGILNRIECWKLNLWLKILVKIDSIYGHSLHIPDVVIFALAENFESSRYFVRIGIEILVCLSVGGGEGMTYKINRHFDPIQHMSTEG